MMFSAGGFHFETYLKGKKIQEISYLVEERYIIV